MGEDFSGDAFVKSKKRMKLFTEGKYTPKSYLLIWPRKKLTDWAYKIKKVNKSTII